MVKVKLLMMALTVIMCWAPAFAQTTAGASGPLRVGQKYLAVQPCGHPNQGVEIEITSISEGGTKAQATIKVNCWGAQSYAAGNTFRFGSVEIHGNVAKFRFFSSGLKYGVTEWSEGTATMQNGKPELRFGPTAMKLSSSSPVSSELIFR